MARCARARAYSSGGHGRFSEHVFSVRRIKLVGGNTGIHMFPENIWLRSKTTGGTSIPGLRKPFFELQARNFYVTQQAGTGPRGVGRCPRGELAAARAGSRPLPARGVGRCPRGEYFGFVQQRFQMVDLDPQNHQYSL